ncbi:hypothetical protein [Clostridium sp.]|uniref:hypothetical protein n=1 Tax=Clostridium sp. TaxID=1506 RepID=UPI003464C642
MFSNTYPLFKPGRILKIEMLEELRDFPREILDISLRNYSSGIISGCNIEVNNDYITVTKGIIKYQDMIYILKEDYTIPYESTNQIQVLKIRFLGETINKDFIKLGSQIFLDDKLETNIDEMELCRFKLKRGAKLRNNYVDFRDISTEYDTVNIINCPFSSYENSTLSPKILRRFGQEVLKCNTNNPLDISFAMMCIQSKEAIDRELIISYIEPRLKTSLRETSNHYLYNKLLEILESIKDGNGGKEKQERLRYKTILVD